MNTELPHETKEFLETLVQSRELIVRQRFELAEMLGIEARNAYHVEGPGGQPIAYAAEQNKGILGFLLRNFLGHWRRFNLLIYGADRQVKLRCDHPFRWFFQRLEVYSGSIYVGALQQRFAIFSKKFDVQDARGRVVLEMRSPFWRIWTFPFRRAVATAEAPAGTEAARIEKKWAGLLSEGFTDKDRFRVVLSPGAGHDEAALVLASAIFIDLQYFERKGNGGGLAGIFD